MTGPSNRLTAGLSWARPGRVLSLAVLIGCAACNGTTPPGSSNGGDTVTGTERFGWDQPAADAGELATFRYAFYVDETRSEASDVNCGTGTTAGPFPCTAGLPQMSTGNHSLQIAAFVLDAGVVRESSRSAAVRVVKQ